MGKLRKDLTWSKWLLLIPAAYLSGCATFAYTLSVGMKSGGDVPKGTTVIEMPGRHYPIVAYSTLDFKKTKKSKKGIVVLVNGGGFAPNQWEPLITELKSRGLDCVAIHSAGTGSSKRATLGWGQVESEEIEDAVKWIRGQAGIQQTVGVVGCDTGASAAWLAAGRNQDQYDAVIVERPFRSSFYAQTEAMDSLMPSGSIAFAPALLVARALTGTGLDPNEMDICAERNLDRRMLIVTSHLDEFGFKKDAHRLADLSRAELWETATVTEDPILIEKAPVAAERIERLLASKPLSGYAKRPS